MRDKSAWKPIWTQERSECARRARCRMHRVNRPERNEGKDHGWSESQICLEQIWTHEVRPEGAVQGCTASINHRHADFESGVRRLLTLYFNTLPGRPLPNLQDNAGLCTASSRKTHARLDQLGAGNKPTGSKSRTELLVNRHANLTHVRQRSGWKRTSENKG